LNDNAQYVFKIKTVNNYNKFKKKSKYSIKFLQKNKYRLKKQNKSE